MAFTKSTKRAIDYSLPSLAAVAVAFYFITKQKDRDIKFLILILILVWVLVYAITSQGTKLLYNASFKKNIDVPVDSVKIVTDADGSTKTVGATSSVDISGLTREIRNDLYDTPFTGHSNTLWWKASLLSDTDLASVFNQWNKEYFDEYDENLIAAIKADSFDAFGLMDNRAYIYKETVLAKLAKMGAK